MPVVSTQDMTFPALILAGQEPAAAPWRSVRTRCSWIIGIWLLWTLSHAKREVVGLCKWSDVQF